MCPTATPPTARATATDTALVTEVKLMAALEHENIVRYLGAEEDVANGDLYIFQEWVPGGALSDVIKQFGVLPMDTIREYLGDLLRGLVCVNLAAARRARVFLTRARSFPSVSRQVLAR